jgi:CHAT domain-containing protein
MRVKRGLRIVVCAAILGTTAVLTQAQASDPVAEAFMLASEAERAAMIAGRPELGDVPFRQALSTHGTEASRRGNFQLAEKYHRAVLWLGDHQQSDMVRAIAYSNLASATGQRGDLAASQAFAIGSITMAERVGDLESVQSASANLGIVQRKLGDLDGALQSFGRALALSQQLKLPDNEARVLNNIGLVYSDLGNLALARDYLDRSLALKMKLDDGGRVTQDIARSLNNIGNLWDAIGDYPQALDHYQRALTLLDRSGGGPSVSSALSNIGHVYIKQGNSALARDFLTRAMTTAEGHGDQPRMATIHYLLGYLDRELGRLPQAEARQRQSLAMREVIGESVALSESLTELSGLALAGGRAPEALEYANRAIAIATEARLMSQQWRAQQAAASALAAMQRQDEAIAQYEAGIAAIETLRQQTAGGDRARQMYLGQRVGPYYGLAKVHADAGRPFEAFAAVERARARTLLDLLAGGRRPTRLLTAEQQRKERDLTQAMLSVSGEIDVLLARRQRDAAQLSELEAKRSRARLERDAYVASLYESKPDLRIARGDAPVITKRELASLLTPATAIVSFVLDNRQAWAYVVTKGTAGVTVTPRLLNVDARALAKLAGEFSQQVAARDLAFAANARKLYDIMFVASKIEPMLNGKSRLIVIPDGPLWRVPFQALQTPRDTFLIEERAISYSPSVSALASLERRRKSRAKRDPFLVALGDPAATRTSGPAPARLPEAAREVAALGQLYGDARSRVVVGERATEAALRGAIGRASIVHVATHGVIDNISPMYSHLMLTSQRSADSNADGRLEAWEITDLPVDADLVVLSACETAKGPVGDGEGVIGLSWSLFAAGASTAVVSQWAVDSASTTALMIAFHERLLLSQPHGRDAANAPEALRVAAMRLMRTPAHRHPFYWAGFVVFGAP